MASRPIELVLYCARRHVDMECVPDPVQKTSKVASSTIFHVCIYIDARLGECLLVVIINKVWLI